MTNINSNSFIQSRTTYCTVTDVEDFLQISGRTTSTNPSTMDIEKLIVRAEKEIDRKTKHSWKLNEVRNEFYDHSDALASRFRDNPGRFRFYDDRGKIPLRHRNIRKILRLDGWDGSQYVDYVTAYQEGRGKDWYCDYEQGVIYFWSRYPWRIRNAIKVDYLWGVDEVPDDIKEACIKIVAKQLLFSDDYSVLFPEGTQNVSLREKADIWKEEIKEILMRRTELLYI